VDHIRDAGFEPEVFHGPGRYDSAAETVFCGRVPG